MPDSLSPTSVLSDHRAATVDAPRVSAGPISMPLLAGLTGFDIPVEERHFYIRLDDAVANLAPKSGEARWFRLRSIALGNVTPDYPNGDHVQAVERWHAPPPGQQRGR